MLNEFNFHLNQCEYVRAAMIRLPLFRPDQKTVEWVEGLIGEGKAVRKDYVGKFNGLTFAKGKTKLAHDDLHNACVSIHQCMKSCYRKDAACLHTLNRVPVHDQSQSETITRALNLSEAWGALPHPPDWKGPFQVGTMDKAAFDGLAKALESVRRLETEADQDFQSAEGTLHQQQRVLADFATAALTQGRGQFKSDPVGLELINRVPTAPASQPPGEMVISRAESPAEESVHLEFDAEHATSFEVWHKGPGQAQFELAEEVLRPGQYVKTGLTGSLHEYKVVGVNSRGEGPASMVVSISVPAAEVA